MPWTKILQFYYKLRNKDKIKLLINIGFVLCLRRYVSYFQSYRGFGRSWTAASHVMLACRVVCICRLHIICFMHWRLKNLDQQHCKSVTFRPYMSGGTEGASNLGLKTNKPELPLLMIVKIVENTLSSHPTKTFSLENTPFRPLKQVQRLQTPTQLWAQCLMTYEMTCHEVPYDIWNDMPWSALWHISVSLVFYSEHNRRRSNVFGDARFWFCPNNN